MSSFSPLVHSVCVNGVGVGSASPGSLASGKFGVLHCSGFLRSLKECFNFYFIIFMYMSVLPACMFVPMSPQRSWIFEEL